MKIVGLFPIPVGFSENPNHKLIKNKLIKECKSLKKKIKKGGNNWDATVYNTCETNNLHDNKNFDDLNDWIFNEVKVFADKLGYTNKKMFCELSWFNYYNKYDYQEAHDHEGNEISAVYFLSTPKNCGRLRLISSEPKGIKHVFVKDNAFTWKQYKVEPKEGLLVMFRSNLMHGVEQNKSNKPRISLAYNFTIK